jgi:hypothetical protein
MTSHDKQVAAAIKAVSTLRYKKIEQVRNFPYLLQLADDIQQATFQYDDDFSRESFIAKNIGPTTYKSFLRFGDSKKVTSSLILIWIRNDGMSLDEQAMHMGNDYGRDILPEELANFIIQNDHGIREFEPVKRIETLKQIWKETTGFNYDWRWIKKHLIIDEPFSEMPF